MTGRGPRRRKDLQRREPRRQAYSRILIVTEGKITEAAYFNGLAKHYRLSTANIVIVGRGADPATVVDEAVKRKSEERRRGDGYDRVFCVFDRNGHANFAAASERARARGIELARSWPCFEFWLLLHFQFSRKPFVAQGTRSACDECIRDLSVHMPQYRKARADMFEELRNRVGSAKHFAQRAQIDALQTGDDNPSTEVHVLVDVLQNLKGS